MPLDSGVGKTRQRGLARDLTTTSYFMDMYMDMSYFTYKRQDYGSSRMVKYTFG